MGGRLILIRRDNPSYQVNAAAVSSAFSAIVPVCKCGEVAGGEDLGAVDGDEGDGDAEEDLGALVEEAVPHTQRRLHRQDVAEYKADSMRQVPLERDINIAAHLLRIVTMSEK